MKDITVCIVDDSQQLRRALKQILDMNPGFKCIAMLGTPDEAVSQIPLLSPDVVMMDINLGTAKNGIDCVRVLKPYLPNTNFLMCTIYEDDENIFEALKAGATGYILKRSTTARILGAIREIHEGGAPISSDIARKVVNAFEQNKVATKNSRDINLLSARENQILSLLAGGLMYKEIAAEL